MARAPIPGGYLETLQEAETKQTNDVAEPIKIDSAPTLTTPQGPPLQTGAELEKEVAELRAWKEERLAA